MKIDMSKKAITNRLKTVNQLRKICLSLANSSAGEKIRKQTADKQRVEHVTRRADQRSVIRTLLAFYITGNTYVAGKTMKTFKFTYWKNGDFFRLSE